jgi:hypothetical protein
MNSISKSNYLPENIETHIETPRTNEAPRQNQASEIDNEDAKFVSEFAWLAAASVTIASIVTGIGLS